MAGSRLLRSEAALARIIARRRGKRSCNSHGEEGARNVALLEEAIA